ncbi:MAG: nitric oxide reductase [Gammaproteobacteria bacterium]|nr:nitric oxide reductase [Gammaproteobacteria bacterium]
MEEQVGALWHRLISSRDTDGYRHAAVTLAEMRDRLGIIFRALGGPAGLVIAPSFATTIRSRQSFRQRLSGSQQRVTLSWRDEQAIHLPAQLQHFPQRELNRDLYIWLTVLLTVAERPSIRLPWLQQNQHFTRLVLERYPALGSRYIALVQGHLSIRPLPQRLPKAEYEQEMAIRSALLQPGSVATLPPAEKPPLPPPLWLHPFPPIDSNRAAFVAEEQQDQGGSDCQQQENEGSYSGERVEAEQQQGGLVTMRMENIFTWGEFVNLDRGSEESDEAQQSAAAADEMEQLAIRRDRAAPASRLRFDLDLPPGIEDEGLCLTGIRLPEWDYRRQQMQADHCRLLELMASDLPPLPLPAELRASALKLRHQFQQLASSRIWKRGVDEGSELDLDACLRFRAERRAGLSCSGGGLYRELRVDAHSMATLLLADLSLSTDSYIDNQRRVIDTIRDALLIFAECLHELHDPFAISGFSSRKRDPVFYHHLKRFDEHYDGTVRARIRAIKPGFYTRMGAAIRHATSLLRGVPAERRLLLLLSDGKPNDIDRYEGRYGVEDTRHAILSARREGIQLFCVTIDRRSSDYLPYIFGSNGYALIHQASQLPQRLPQLYAQLVRG